MAGQGFMVYKAITSFDQAKVNRADCLIHAVLQPCLQYFTQAGVPPCIGQLQINFQAFPSSRHM